MATSLKDVFESGEKIGWLGIVALGVILVGLFLVHGPGLFTLDPRVWSGDSRIGLALLALGVLMAVVGLAAAAARVKAADENANNRAAIPNAELRLQVAALEKQAKESQAELSQIESRRAVYNEAWNIIRGHKAVSFQDNPEFIRRVINSAETLQVQMDKLRTSGKLDRHAQEFTSQIRRVAKDFYIDCEQQLEQNGLLPTKDQSPDARLADHPEAFPLAVQFHKRWTGRTEALFLGAASMLGIDPPRFDW
jgi:hypothetical protein